MVVSILRPLLMVALLAQGPRGAAPVPAPATPVIPPTEADFALTAKGTSQNWPMFRGAQASGVADAQGAVVEWDVKSGKNVRWKTPIPGVANASPVIWGNRIYVVTAISSSGDTMFQAGNAGINAHADISEHTWRLYALDSATGAIVWDKEVHKSVPRTKRHPKGSQAAATPVTDGRRVAVLFGTAGILAAYDTSGTQLWKKDLGLIDNGYVADPTQQWGHSASPILYENSVIIQADQQKGSYVAAFDLADGKELWKTIREDEISSWGTPLVVKGKAGDELITNGTKIRGYDPKTGKIRWTLGPNSQVVIPTPIAGNEIVYVSGGYQPVRPIYAIKPGGSGDISLPTGKTSSDSITWSVDRDGPYISTPLLYRGVLYSLNNNGVLNTFDALNGERLYRGRVGPGGAFSASPIAADGRLYFSNEDGQVYVVRAGKDYVQIAVNEMSEPITATPAIADGLTVVRTVRAVYGIGTK
jgi:outer membrane protein assembly factor BamB